MNRHNGHKKFWILTCIIAAIIVAGFLGYQLFRVEKITVTGNSTYTDEEVADLASIPVNTHFFVIDFDEVQQNIESDPYLIVNSIDFEIPNNLVIDVKERIPVAKTLVGDKYLLLTDEMLVISDNQKKVSGINLEIKGLNTQEYVLGEEVPADIPYKTAVLKSILKELENQASLDVLSEIDVSDVNSIKMKTSSGYDVLFGQGDNYASKIKWINKMIETLSSQGVSSGEIDVSSGDFATFKNDSVPIEQVQLITDDQLQPEAEISGDSVTEQNEMTEDEPVLESSQPGI